MSINRYQKGNAELIKDEAFFTVWGFMRKELHLEKTELSVYALIYGYFRNGETFTGSRRYISDWTGSGHSAVSEALDSLVKKGYIRRSKGHWRGICVIEYSINVDSLPDIPMHSHMLRLNKNEQQKTAEQYS